MDNFPEAGLLSEDDVMGVAVLFSAAFEVSKSDPHDGRSRQMVAFDPIGGRIHNFFFGDDPNAEPPEDPEQETVVAAAFSRSLVHPEEPNQALLMSLDDEQRPFFRTLTHSSLVPTQGAGDYRYEDQAFIRPDAAQELLTNVEEGTLAAATLLDKMRIDEIFEQQADGGLGFLTLPPLSAVPEGSRAALERALDEQHMRAFLPQIRAMSAWMVANESQLLQGSGLISRDSDSPAGTILGSGMQLPEGLHSGLLATLDDPKFTPYRSPLQPQFAFTIGEFERRVVASKYRLTTSFITDIESMPGSEILDDEEKAEMEAAASKGGFMAQIRPEQEPEHLSVADARLILNIMQSMS